jgi:tetratricopeptide (TPR) repeat protein
MAVPFWKGKDRFPLRSLDRILALCLLCTSLVFARGPVIFETAQQAPAATAAGRRGDAPELTAARAAIARGNYDEALKLLAAPAAADADGDSALELGLLEMLLGRASEARPRLLAILEQASGYDEPQDLLRAGRAARALGDYREANTYLREAASQATDDPEINTAWGDLFLEKYNRVDAARSYQTALQANPAWAPALVGLARTMVDENPPGASALAARALTADPAYVPAHLLIAELALDDSRRDVARESIGRALEQNPQSLEARSLLAAIANLEGRTADFDAEVRRVLAINPHYGEVFRVAGDHAARNYRFEEAVALVRRGLELDPESPRAHADLGIHLLRTGDEDEARAALDKAFKADPYDVVTYNLLGLFDSLEKFETITEGDVVLRIHTEEAPVLKEYALPLARDALRTLSTRYEFTPRGPVLIEIFPRHDDFAVRNVGLPGMIGALGACFGRVVTMDSPKARPPGTFDWRATLWHELTHVITLQMSNQRIPRWLTEGISGYEERRARPEWGRDMDVEFIRAVVRGEALKLKDLNAGFQKPETIALAYYQAALLVEHLIELRGEPALHKLIRSFADGRDLDKALNDVYGSTMDGLQAGFDRMVDLKFGSLKAALTPPEDTGEGHNLEALRHLAQAHPGSYDVQLALGSMLMAEDDTEGAIRALERATELVPVAQGPESARALLIDSLLKKGDRAAAMGQLEALLGHDHSNVAAARKLAELATEAKDGPRQWLAYERVAGLDPFDAGAHTALGRLALERNETAMAVREFRAALAVGPLDVAAAHCDLAEGYLRAGQKGDAKRQALAALEIAPSYVRAQELLLQTVQGQP